MKVYHKKELQALNYMTLFYTHPVVAYLMGFLETTQPHQFSSTQCTVATVCSICSHVYSINFVTNTV